MPRCFQRRLSQTCCNCETFKYFNQKSSFSPFPLTDAFWHLCSRRLLLTLWQKEKLLIMSNYNFCRNFQLYSIIKNLFYIYFPYFGKAVFKVFCCRIVVCGKGLKVNPTIWNESRLLSKICDRASQALVQAQVMSYVDCN